MNSLETDVKDKNSNELSQTSDKPLLKIEPLMGNTIDPSDTYAKISEFEIDTTKKNDNLLIVPETERAALISKSDNGNKIVPINKADSVVRFQWAKANKLSQSIDETKYEQKDQDWRPATVDVFDGKLPRVDPLQRVKAEYLIANNKITPFDSSQFIQTLFLPVTPKQEDDPDHVVVTVQLYQQNVVPFTGRENSEPPTNQSDWLLPSNSDVNNELPNTCFIGTHELQLYPFKTKLELEQGSKDTVKDRITKFNLQKQIKVLTQQNQEEKKQKDLIQCWFCLEAKADITVPQEDQPLQFYYCHVCHDDDKKVKKDGDAIQQPQVEVTNSKDKKKKDFFVCETCHAMRLTRAKIKSLTQNHCYYQNYHLEAYDDEQGKSDQNVPSNIDDSKTTTLGSSVAEPNAGTIQQEIASNVGISSAINYIDGSNWQNQIEQQEIEHKKFESVLLQREKESRVLSQQEKKAESLRFAQVRKDRYQEPKRPFGKFIEIGIWQLTKDGSYSCYRIYQVLRPLVFNYEKKGEKMYHFLIKGGKEGKDLYFIENQAQRYDRSRGSERPSNDEYALRRINLEKLTDYTKTDDLTLIRKGCFKIPTHADSVTKFQNKHNELLKQINLIEKHKTLTSYPLVVSKNDFDYLVLVGNYAWTPEKSGQQVRVDTDGYQNLHFLNIGNEKLDWTIFGANLFLGFSKDEQAVFFLNQSHINKIVWFVQPYSGDINAEDLKKSPPEQEIETKYAFSVSTDVKSYIDQVDAVKSQIQEAIAKKQFLEGVKHKNQPRVSLICGEIGLQTFYLKDKKFNWYTQGRYIGRVGLLNDVKLNIGFQRIDGIEKVEGSCTVKGQEIKINGTTNYQESPWSGTIQMIKENDTSDPKSAKTADETQESGVPKQQTITFAKFEADKERMIVTAKGFVGEQKENKTFNFENDPITIVPKPPSQNPDQDEFNQDQNQTVQDEYQFTIKTTDESATQITCKFKLNELKNDSLIGECDYKVGSAIEKRQFNFKKKEATCGIEYTFQFKDGDKLVERFLKGFNNWSDNTFDGQKNLDKYPKNSSSKSVDPESFTRRIFGTDSSQESFMAYGIDHSDLAVKLKTSQNVTDACFCEFQEGKETKLFAVAGLEMRGQKNNQPGYNVFLVDLLDLDRADDHEQSKPKKIQQLQFLVPDNLRQIKDDHGYKILPFYSFNAFKINKVSTVDKSEYYEFKGQMVFKDIFSTLKKLVFIKGKSPKKDVNANQADAATLSNQIKEEEKLQLPEWMSSVGEQFLITYPILAYKSNKQSDNEIVICNLAMNTPQKVINLGSFKFLQFLDTGLNPEKLFIDDDLGLINCTIFFLVEIESHLRVAYYRYFPWQVQRESVQYTHMDHFQFDDEIRILKGSFDLSKLNNYESSRIIQEKVKVGSILVKKDAVDEIEVVLVLQLIDGIEAFDLNRGEKLRTESVLPKGYTMNQERMQRGPDQSIYFTEISDTNNYQIVRLSLAEQNEIARTVLFKLNQNKIIQFQLDYFGKKKKKSQIEYCFLMIDSEKNFMKLEFLDESMNELEVTQTNSLANHTGITRMLHKSEQTSWDAAILNEQGINALQINKDNTQSKINAVSFRIHSQMQKEHEFFQFKDDMKLIRKRLELPERNFKNNVLSLFDVPWIGKHVYEVDEGGFSYFLIQNEFFTNSLSLMRHDTQNTLMEDQVLIGNDAIGVKLKYTNQYIFISQRNQTYLSTQKFNQVEPLSTINSSHQYFRCSTKEKTEKRIVAFDKSCAQVFDIFDDQNLKAFQDKLEENLKPNYEIFASQGIAASSFDVDSDDTRFKWQKEDVTSSLPVSLKATMYTSTNSADSQYSEIKKKFPGFVCSLFWIQPTVSSEVQKIAKNGAGAIKNDFNFLKDDGSEKEYILGRVILVRIKDFFEQPVPDVNQRQENQPKSAANQAKKEIIKPEIRADFLKVYGFALYFQNMPEVLRMSKSEVEQIQFHLTRDYLVVALKTHIIYIKISKLKRKDDFGNELLSSLSDFIEEPIAKGVHQSFKAKFKVINFGKLEQSLTQHGIKIAVATQKNVRIADKGRQRVNVIQISFANVSLLWDLKENEEITFVEEQAQFCNHKTYVNTGMMPHAHESKSNKNMADSKFMTANESGTLMLIPKTGTSKFTLFRGFSYMSLLDVLYLKNRIKDSLAVQRLDLHTVLQNFDGYTFFEIFKSEIDYLDLIYEQVQALELQDQKVVDQFGQQIDNIWIRQLFWTLNLPIKGDISQKEEVRYLPTVEEIESSILKLAQQVKRLYRGKWLEIEEPQQDKDLKPSLLQDLLFDDQNSHVIDPLLKLTMLSNEYRLCNLIRNYQSFEKVFKMQSTQITIFLEESFLQNQQCTELQNMLWNKDDELLSFLSETSLLSTEQIKQKLIKNKESKKGKCSKFKAFFVSQLEDTKEKIVPIEVRMIEVGWLTDSRSFYNYLGKLDENAIFANELIRVLLGQNNYTSQIVVKVVIPFFVYMVISLYYFSFVVPEVKVESFMGVSGDRQGAGLRILIIIFASTFLVVEVRQMFSAQLKYFTSFWNVIYIVANALPIFIVVEHGNHHLGIKPQILTQLASFQTVILWLMVFYWCRIVPELAFFVTMVSETIADIGMFMIMLILCIIMFANGIYVLNRGTKHIYDQDMLQTDMNPLFSPSFNNEYLDALMSQWNLGLGNFYTDPFSTDKSSVLCWIYFVFATFFTNITFMNMLIALMSTTFGRVQEERERNSLMEITQMYTDFLWAININKDFETTRYLYIARPVSQENKDDSIENSIVAIRRQLGQLEKRTQESIIDTSGRISVEIEDLNRKVHDNYLTSQKTAEQIEEMKISLDKIMKALKVQ